ncbi:MAG: M48 family metalloprotease [Pseudomonadota bacterium]
MLKVNGLYGHVAQNNLRSLWVFTGFAVAFQIICAVLLTPFLMIFDLQNWFLVNPLGYLKLYVFPVFVFGVAYFSLNFYLHANTIRNELGFDEATGHDRQRLSQIVNPLSITAGITAPEIDIIETSARNAFVCGWSMNSAKLVVTRGLLDALNDDELAAVIAHELVHIKNGDILLMAFANVAVTCIKVLEKMNIFKVKSGKRFIIFIFLPFLIVIFLMLTMMVNFTMHVGTSIGKISRLVIASSREFIADAEAVRLTHNPGALISALMKIEGRSTIDGLDPLVEAMMIDGAAMGEFATHPTISERIATLRRHTGAMAILPDQAMGSLKTFSDFRAAYSSNQYDNDMQQPVFGKRNRAAEPVHQSAKPQPRTVYERINAGSDRSAHGIPSHIMTIIRWGLIIMLILNFAVMWQFQRTMENGGVSKPVPGISGSIRTKKDYVPLTE